jgi:hypothetical protein
VYLVFYMHKHIYFLGYLIFIDMIMYILVIKYKIV